MKTQRCIAFALVIGSAFTALATDTIYHNGTVLTMDDANPTAEAVAVQDGKIVAVGTDDEVMKSKDSGTQLVDLGGKTLLPGFFDSHGHAYLIGIQASTANLLPAPDGKVGSIDQLVESLKDWAKAYPERVERVGWIAGFGYDDAQLAELRHPTRDDLDRVSTDLPIIVIHQSGHMGSANSKALELAGITAETENPAGGVFARREGSNEPNGFAQEYAFFQLIGGLAANFDDDVNDHLIIEGTKLLATYGYTTGQEGRATGPAIEAMKRVSQAGKLDIDLVTYPDILAVESIEASMEYQNRFRIGGAKLTIDGSPQGKTAWLTEPYFVPPAGEDEDYVGYGAITEKQAIDAVEKAYEEGLQIICHANGDKAIDIFIDAISKAEKRHPKLNNRPVLIHGQTLRHDQVYKLKDLKIFPSLFPMHTYYWGDWHRDSVLGPERADNISPTGWVLAEGMIFGTHHDAPVALPDSMRILSATVTRRSRSGDIIGPIHKVPVATALKAMTLWAAWQHFEEDSKGSIEVGKIADFVLLSDNPLEVPEAQLASLHVLETIKDGVSIYQRPDDAASLPQPATFGLVRSEGHDHPSYIKHMACGDGCFSPALSLLLEALQKQ